MKRPTGILALAAVCWSATAPAQDFPIEFLRNSAARRGEPGQSVATLRQLAAAEKLDVARRAEVDALLHAAEASAAAGKTADAQRALSQARAVLNNKTWTPAQAFASSLDVAPAAAIVDQSERLVVSVKQSYPSPGTSDARLRVSLERRGQPPVLIGERRLTARMGRVSFLAPGVQPGRYSVVEDLVVNGSPLAHSTAQIDLVRDLRKNEAAVRARLAKLSPSSSAEALVLYPYELARLVLSGRRELERSPLEARIARSDEVLLALEQGRDLTVRGVGDQHRAYRLDEAGEIMPYRIYVPTWWNGHDALPIVLALHGGGGDENEMLEIDSGKFGKLAERYGYIVVSPFGYRPVGAWGSPIRLPSVYGSTITEGRDVGGPERAHLLELSEKDALNALERTVTEYGADRSRMYVTGHSMGGGGTWYMAYKHRDLWDGMAASAGPFFIDNYDFDRLRGMGIMIVQGEGDPPSLAADRKLAGDLLARGIGVTYLETPAVNHGQTFGASLPSIVEFFERQKLRRDPTIKLSLK